MAKSNTQKQQEAIERKRQAFPKKIAEWCAAQPGGEYYNSVAQYDSERANQVARDAEKALVKAAQEAHVDRYGNPI